MQRNLAGFTREGCPLAEVKEGAACAKASTRSRDFASNSICKCLDHAYWPCTRYCSTNSHPETSFRGHSHRSEGGVLQRRSVDSPSLHRTTCFGAFPGSGALFPVDAPKLSSGAAGSTIPAHGYQTPHRSRPPALNEIIVEPMYPLKRKTRNLMAVSYNNLTTSNKSFVSNQFAVRVVRRRQPLPPAWEGQK